MPYVPFLYSIFVLFSFENFIEWSFETFTKTGEAAISLAHTSNKKLAGNVLGRARTSGIFGSYIFYTFSSENIKNTYVLVSDKKNYYLCNENNYVNGHLFSCFLYFLYLGQPVNQMPLREELNWPSREVYDKIRTFVLFIGYPRSGHSLVGSLIDAHPHAVVSHEVDIISEWKNLDPPRRNRYTLFDLLYHDSNLEAKSGIRSNSTRHAYTYNVPNQWQGKYDKHIMVRKYQLVIFFFNFFLN